MELALAATLNNPVRRIAQGDVALGSIFVQMHAAHIILAVKEGYITIVERSDESKGRMFLEITDKGKEFWKLK